MYASFIPMTPSSTVPLTRTPPQIIYIQQRSITDTELYFAYFSLYILFPLLYNMLLTGDKSIVMVLWRYITSGVFDTVSYIKEVATELFYTSLRIFGQYTFSTYTVVKDGREIFTSSSIYYYYKSDLKSVYRIDRAKYNVCKWIDRQCALFLKIHGEEAIINDTENEIYDFILHKVDNQPYVRIHRGNFTGRTHTLITEHYRPYSKSYQFAPEAELTVWYPNCSLEPPMESNEGTADDNAANDAGKEHTVYECYPPKVFKLNLKTPDHFFLEKNELLDVKFLKWKLYNEFGAADIAKRLNSVFYNYKVGMFYNDCMKEDTVKTKAEVAIVEAEAVNEGGAEAVTDKPFVAYNLSDKQSVIVGHTYVVKVDSLLRCPVFESNEKNVFDIDGVLTSYYTCSDTENDSSDERDEEDDSSVESESEAVVHGDGDGEDADEDEAPSNDIAEQQNPEYDETEFEVIQESST
jgi:hypothetical protein